MRHIAHWLSVRDSIDAIFRDPDSHKPAYIHFYMRDGDLICEATATPISPQNDPEGKSAPQAMEVTARLHDTIAMALVQHDRAYVRVCGGKVNVMLRGTWLHPIPVDGESPVRSWEGEPSEKVRVLMQVVAETMPYVAWEEK